MYILIKNNALQLHSRTIPTHLGYTSTQFFYRDSLREVVGKWVEVEVESKVKIPWDMNNKGKIVPETFVLEKYIVCTPKGCISIPKTFVEEVQDFFGYSHVVCTDCDEVFSYADFSSLEVHKEECGGEIEFLEVIASWGISNSASYNVFKLEDGRMLVGCNDFKPEWLAIDEFYVDGDNDLLDTTLDNTERECKSGVKIGESVWFLDECMKV